MDPSKKSINIIKKTVNELGEVDRLSETDIELLALAYEIKQQKTSEPVILTDDYSIQNTANFLDIRFESISQKGIKKSFKWINRCRGCGKTFKENIKECPICGTETKKIIIDKKTLKKR